MKFGKRILSVLLSLTFVFTSFGTVMSAAAVEATHEHTETVSVKEGEEPPKTTEKPSDKPTDPPETEHKHDYISKVTQKATCTLPEITTYTCSCGDLYTKETHAALGHNWSNRWTETKHPTCVSTGIKSRHCLNGCREVDTEIVPAKGHHFTVLQQDLSKPATCTDPAKNVYKCEDCKETETKTVGNPLGHDITVFISKEEATCTKDGNEVYKCSRCSETHTKTITAKGHSFTSWTETQKMTCTQDKIETESCSNCGALGTKTRTTKATGHKFSEWTTTKEATCTEKGTEERTCSVCGTKETKEISESKHTYEWRTTKEPTCTETGVQQHRCTACDKKDPDFIFGRDKELEALGHKVDYDHGTVIKEVSCSQNEETEYKCTRCDYKEKAVTKNALGHDWDNKDFAVYKKATCTEKGELKRTCKRCNLSETKEIAATGHEASGKFRPVPGKEATCTKDGFRMAVCKKCDKTFGEELSYPKFGHAWGDWKIIEPTYEKDGKKYRECVRCNAKGDEYVIPKIAKDHKHDIKGKKVTIREATCVEEGVLRIHCSHKNCQAFTEEPIAPSGHNFGRFTEIQAPDCVNTGVRRSTCKNCGTTQSETTPPLGHTYGEWIETREATTEQSGIRQRTCSVCGDIQMEAFLIEPEESVDLNATLPNGAHGVTLTAPTGKAVNEAERKSKNRKNAAIIASVTAVLAAGTAGVGFVIMKKKKIDM